MMPESEVVRPEQGRRGESVICSGASLSVTVVDTLDGFDRLEEPWQTIVAKSDCSIFQTFEWQRTWWKYFSEGRELYCLVFSQGEKIVGIAPMFRQNVNVSGIRVARWLRFIGTGISDYLAVISTPDYEEQVVERLALYLSGSPREWDIFEITDVNDRYRQVRLLPKYLGEMGLKVYTYLGNSCPELSLSPTWDGFLQHQSGNMRSQMRRKMGRLNERFRVDVERYGNRMEEVREAVEEAARLHGRRWKSLGYENAFDDPNYLAFHVEVAEKFAGRGWMRIHLLKVEGDTVAVQFNFNYRKRIYFFLGQAYGPREILRYSPGFLLRCIAIEDGIGEGMEVYDFLRGEEAYKYAEFKSTKSGNWMIRASRPSLYPRIRFAAFITNELLKKVPERLKKDYHEGKRLVMTEGFSAAGLSRFFAAKLAALWRNGLYYVLRFSSAKRSEQEHR